MRQPSVRDFLRKRPVVRKRSATHYQIRQLREPKSSGHGCYLVWPDGYTGRDTMPLATTYDLTRAVEKARRP